MTEEKRRENILKNLDPQERQLTGFGFRISDLEGDVETLQRKVGILVNENTLLTKRWNDTNDTMEDYKTVLTHRIQKVHNELRAKLENRTKKLEKKKEKETKPHWTDIFRKNL